MNIVILTSSDHIYANLVMNHLLRNDGFKGCRVFALEQECLVPGLSLLQGLARYLIKSGFHYVATQVIKQLAFKSFRFFAAITSRRDSVFFPYYINTHPLFERKKLNHIKKKENAEYICSLSPDIILSLYSKEWIPSSIINSAKIAAVNAHPSLLPAYKGVSPIFWALATGEDETGITIHHLSKKFDEGAIISQKKVALKPGVSEHSIYVECSKALAEMLLAFLKEIEDGKTPKEPEIPGGKPSYFSLPTKVAVKEFVKRGHVFFHIKELINDY